MTRCQFNERPACSVKNEPFPEEVRCTGCGAWIEVWSDEDEACCVRCGRIVRKEE
jgi:uncharacterized paraquat-inducible protein A